MIDEADEPRRRSWVGDTVSNAVTRVGDRVGGRVESASRSVVDDLVDDLKVRDLIREQSQGLDIDRAERVRAPVVENPADLPPGRVRSHGGAVTRLVALGFDLGLVSLVAVQGLTAVVAVLSTAVSPVPAWLVGSAAFVSAGLAPIYFAVSWWLAGRTFGGNLAGFVVCAQDGEQLRFRNSVDVYRRGWLDLLTRTRTPYRVHVQVRPETLATAVPAS